MDDDLIRMTPNPDRAKNILSQVEIRLEALASMDSKFITLKLEAQYEIIKELLTALLAADGYKTLSHAALIEYLRQQYSKVFTEQEIRSLDELRKVRNRIAYEGFTISQDYYERKAPVAAAIIARLHQLVQSRL